MFYYKGAETRTRIVQGELSCWSEDLQWKSTIARGFSFDQMVKLASAHHPTVIFVTSQLLYGFRCAQMERLLKQKLLMVQ